MKKPMVACALALMSFSSAADADNYKLGDTDNSKISIPYGDLNLSNAAGAKVMMQRINFAATVACGGKPDLREMKIYTLFKACVREAKDEAVHDLNAPLLTSLWTEEKVKEDQLASVD